MSPQAIIKSQVIDDKFEVDLNEILEKYGMVLDDGYFYKTITLQIYNKVASDEAQNFISYANYSVLGNVVVNGSITITKLSLDEVYIQGMLIDNNGVYIPHLEIDSESYEDGILLSSSNEFDLYVIRV